MLRLTDYTLTSVPTDAFQTYRGATGGTSDVDTGLLSIMQSQSSALQTSSFNIGGTVYDLSPNAQIWPRSLNTAIGGSSESIHLIIGDIGTNIGSGLDFINGYALLYFSFLSGYLGCVSIIASATIAFSILPTSMSALPLRPIPEQLPTRVFGTRHFIRPAHDTYYKTCSHISVIYRLYYSKGLSDQPSRAILE